MIIYTLLFCVTSMQVYNNYVHTHARIVQTVHCNIMTMFYVLV